MSAAQPRPRIIHPKAPTAPGSETLGSQAARELWLALYLPQYMLDALDSTIATLRGPPIAGQAVPSPTRAEAPVSGPRAGLAVVDLERGGRVVCACDATAAAAGIAPGMALNSALALSPQLQTQARDPRREGELLDALAEWALRFTPRVSIEPPDAVLLEVRGSLRLFGGARRLCERIRMELLAVGLEPRLAITPTPLASLWMARAGRQGGIQHPAELAGRLADLPIHCTRWPSRCLQMLATMGVRTVGDCLRLPRDGFARRLEPRQLDMLDRAIGRQPEPRSNFIPRERFKAARDLEPELSDISRFDAAVAPLLDDLCAFLRQRRRGVQDLELRLVHREAPPMRLRLRFAEPVAEVDRIAGLLHERLARIVLAEPVRTLRLRSGPLVESREEPTDLFVADRRQFGVGVPQLVERLRARLGSDAVHGLCLVAEHRPESAWSVTGPERGDASLFPSTGQGKRPLSQPPLPRRPLWLLGEPQPLGTGDLPCFEGELALEEGPERIESGWWDGREVRRDYYVARNPAGVRLWVFRDRRRRGGSTGVWFLHGVFG